MLVTRYDVVEKVEGVEADALAILVFKGEDIKEVFGGLDAAVSNALSSLGELGSFTFDEGKVEVIYAPSTPFKRLIVVGGGEGKATTETLRVYGGAAVAKAKELGVKRLAIHFRCPNGVGTPHKCLEAIAEGASLANYSWSRKSPSNNAKRVEKAFLVGHEPIDGWEDVLCVVDAVADACRLGRDLANAPASEINPATFVERVREEFKGLPVKIEVLEEDELRRLGMNGILAVGKGSEVGPRLLIIEYKGAGDEKPWYVVVGKGVCFDAGGLDIKSASSMLEMKYDKSGAAYAVAVAYGAAKLGLKVNLAALTPLVENLPSGKSYKPLDVIKMYNGLTVEVANTDAEGRLILADTLAYAAKKYKPATMVDLATLTGGIIVALGNQAAGLFSNDEELKEELLRLSKDTGEKLWPFPLWREYHEDIKSDVADVKNIGYPRVASSIIGATFLSKFVGDVKWAHIDIAGTAWTQQEGPKKPYYPKGATAYCVRLLLKFLAEHEE